VQIYFLQTKQFDIKIFTSQLIQLSSCRFVTNNHFGKLYYFATVIQVSQLFIYPIKSLGGIAVQQATIEHTGFAYDRRWMLVDENNKFITQRTHAKLALLQTAITPNALLVQHCQQADQSIAISLLPPQAPVIMVQVWDDTCAAVVADAACNEWFSDMLNLKCKLVYMPINSQRLVDPRYALHNDITSFSDGYPINMISEESLADLNNRLPAALPINRFRPNIVIKGCEPYEEDIMQQIHINGIELSGVKLCSRCVVTTINQQNLSTSKEPLKTLSTYRKRNNKIYFGQNVLFSNSGTITVGDQLYVDKRNEWPVFDC
jgi:uncharacterized protein